MFYLIRDISRHILINICNSFFFEQGRSLYFFSIKESARLNKKMEHLLQKQENNISSNINPIYYFCTIRNDNSVNSNNIPILRTNKQIFFSFSHSKHIDTHSLEIFLSLPFSSSDTFSLMNIRDKWFTNLSSQFLTMCCLQLGGNFSFSSNNKGKVAFEFKMLNIKNVEHYTYKLPIAKGVDIRNHSIPNLITFFTHLTRSPLLNPKSLY